QARAAPVARPKHPVTETVVIRTEQTKGKKRQADGGFLAKTSLLPIVAGVAGGAATVYATSKLNWHPVAVAGVGAAAGLALASASKTPWIRQAGMGAAIGAATLGGVQLVGSLLKSNGTTSQSATAAAPKRNADGFEREADGADGFITRNEL